MCFELPQARMCSGAGRCPTYRTCHVPTCTTFHGGVLQRSFERPDQLAKCRRAIERNGPVLTGVHHALVADPPRNQFDHHLSQVAQRHHLGRCDRHPGSVLHTVRRQFRVRGCWLRIPCGPECHRRNGQRVCQHGHRCTRRGCARQIDPAGR